MTREGARRRKDEINAYEKEWNEATIIPATPGQTFVGIDFCGEEPKNDPMYITRWPVLAWRVQRYEGIFLTPITCDPLPPHILVELPDGRVCTPCDVLYENLESALSDIVKEARIQWLFERGMRDEATALRSAP